MIMSRRNASIGLVGGVATVALILAGIHAHAGLAASGPQQRHVQMTQDTLRVLADETGGFAIVNQNSFSNGLKRIDAETGDYYVIGYYSSNADPLKRRRAIEIKVKRPRVQVKHRAEYFLRPKER
jgi:VWFA-related protein